MLVPALVVALVLAGPALGAGLPAAEVADAVSGPSTHPLRFEVVVPAAADRVWEAWTRGERASEWWAPDVVIDPVPMGRLRVHFFPQGAPEERGTGALHVLAVEPGRMLRFTWDAPPAWPEIRRQRTTVTVRLTPVGDGARTRVSLAHEGWAETGDWPEVRHYFGSAWTVVLGRLLRRFEEGPVPWAEPGDEARWRARVLRTDEP